MTFTYSPAVKLSTSLRSVGKRQACLGHTYLQRDIGRGFDYREDHRVCKTDVLSRTDEKTPYRRGHIAGFEKTGKIVDCGIGIGAAH